MSSDVKCICLFYHINFTLDDHFNISSMKTPFVQWPIICSSNMCMCLFVLKWFSQWQQFHWFTSLPVYLHGVSLSCDSYVDLRPLKCCSASFTKASWSTPGNNSTIFLNFSKVLHTNSRRWKRRIWVLIINSWLRIWMFVTNSPKVEKKYM